MLLFRSLSPNEFPCLALLVLGEQKKKNTLLKSCCLRDTNTILSALSASILFDSGHVQVRFVIHENEIRFSVIQGVSTKLFDV